MPPGKTGRTATTSNITKARKDTVSETTLIEKSKNLDPSLTTTIKPRRSPRNHESSKTAAKEHPLSKGNEQSTIDNHITTKKDANVRNATALPVTTRATVTSQVAAKSSQKSKDKAKAVVQSNRRTSGRLKRADPVPPSSSTRNLRPSRGPKVSAKSKQRVGRDPERSASRHRTKRQSGKADDPSKASAIERGTQNRASSKSVTELIPAPVDNAETLHATEPQLGPIQEDHYALDSHQLLTREALEELTRGLESIDPTNQDDSSQGSAISSQERFNRKWGYVPPLDEETTRIIEAIIKNPSRAETMVGIGPEKPEFLAGLRRRNVLSDPSTHLDPRKEQIQSISLEGFAQETQEQETYHEELWKSDKAKCTPDSSEALYQRTLMINLIARHFLIYQFDSSKEQIFDFSVEEPWGCLPMPSRTIWNRLRGPKISEGKYLTQPKPDLAVCFKREAVISDKMWMTLPDPIQGLACFENSFSNASRVFHFLAVEAKKAMLDLNSPQALYQCLNNASQALHNMFEFFRDASPEHEQVFYNKVRFFSVVANRNGIIVRIHRAIRKPNDASIYELVMPDQPRYRLQFEFREFQRISGDEFTRENVLEAIKKILKYATYDLLEWIKAAASKLVQNIENDPGFYDARCAEDFYSYGQPNPKSLKSSRRATTPSKTNDGVQQPFQNVSLGSNCAPSDQPIASEQMTIKQPHQPVISSRLATAAKKRGVDEIELAELEDPLIRKRRRSSRSNSELILPTLATASITAGSQ